MDHDHNRRMVRVLVADNSPFHTELLVAALSRDPEFHLVSSDLNPSSVLAASSSQRIDVFVLGAFAKGDSLGFKVLQQLREVNPQARAVMLLDSSTPDEILAAFRAGARGVFHHQESSDVLSLCIRRVHEGQAWISHQQMTLVLEALASAPKLQAVDGKGMNLLSKREVEVVRFLAEGMTNREIAERMGLSQHTIKNYLFRIFDKLGVSNRIELLFMTLSQGAPAPLLFNGLTMDPAHGYDDKTFASCRKAAENGVVTAQVALARMLSMGKTSDRDLIQAFTWFSVAIDQINRIKNGVKKAMNPAQLAEAERRAREFLDKSHRIEPKPATSTRSLDYEGTQEIPDFSL